MVKTGSAQKTLCSSKAETHSRWSICLSLLSSTLHDFAKQKSLKSHFSEVEQCHLKKRGGGVLKCSGNSTQFRFYHDPLVGPRSIFCRPYGVRQSDLLEGTFMRSPI